MDTVSREHRHYRTTQLQTLREGFDVTHNRDLLLELYRQICSIWQEMVEVRFKLLAIVPSVTFLLLVAALSNRGPSGGLSQYSRLLLSAFGLIATFGLFVYDRRNSALHDDLISRGRKIEDELVSCLSWNWRERSSVKITERAHAKRAKALHWGREGCHPQAALAG
jgi:hypothetical protein